jgi:hypothetical protein
MGEDFTGASAQDEEFVMSHCDNVRLTGFLEHIKLPHYVDFQSELELVRNMRREAARGAAPPPQSFSGACLAPPGPESPAKPTRGEGAGGAPVKTAARMPGTPE